MFLDLSLFEAKLGLTYILILVTFVFIFYGTLILKRLKEIIEINKKILGFVDYTLPPKHSNCRCSIDGDSLKGYSEKRRNLEFMEFKIEPDKRTQITTERNKKRLEELEKKNEK